MLPRPLTIGLTVLISVVWAVNVVIGFVEPDRHDPTINAVFAVVVGAVYALGRKDSDAIRAARRRLGQMVGGEDSTCGQPPAPDHPEKAQP